MSLFHRVTRNETPSDLRLHGQFATPTMVPLVRILTTNNVIGYEDTQTLWTTDGAPIMATSPGTWGQLYAAGRV